MFSPVDFTVLENTVVKSKKIRIYPKSNLNRYLGLSRYWFNKAVEYLKQPDTKAYLPEVRKIRHNDHPEWAFDCPQRIREHAIADACRAVKNAKQKFLNGEGFQEVKFRSKKHPKQSFGLDKISLHENFIFKPYKYRKEFYASEDFNSALEGSRIIRKNGRWFLILPQKVPVKTPKNQRLGSVSLDPGVRTFMSIYSPEVSGKLGEGDFKRIYRLCLIMDKLIGKMTKASCKARRGMRKALQRLRWKIRDLIDELHKKIAYFLVTRFDKIYLPSFETSEMVTKLRSKTARSMLTFGHYRFKKYLEFKGEEYSCEIISDANEAYTSKTCSYCGQVHNIGSKRQLECRCGAIVDRDLNGARGIYLRAVVVTPYLEADSIC
jgi:putative transposase